jgi:probable F420-dependent oxidoreductase
MTEPAPTSSNGPTSSSKSDVALGSIFPQTEIGSDPAGVRSYVQSVEQLGYTHLIVYDHVLGVDRDLQPDFVGQYDVDSTFHEPFVLFGYLAAITNSIELVTGVIVAPQRQTAVMAKQAAEVDLLSGGRLSLGVGVGWNAFEYTALGQDFHTRGARLDDQIALLRALWSRRAVTWDSRFDHMAGMGISPRPARGSIPIWIGARSDAAYRRVGRLADGWFPRVSAGPKFEHARQVVAAAARDAARDPATIGVNCRLAWNGDLDSLVERAARWIDLGATQLSIETTGVGLTSVAEHVDALEQAMEAVSSLSSIRTANQ